MTSYNKDRVSFCDLISSKRGAGGREEEPRENDPGRHDRLILVALSKALGEENSHNFKLIFSKCSSSEDREMGVKQSSDGREEDRKGG